VLTAKFEQKLSLTVGAFCTTNTIAQLIQHLSVKKKVFYINSQKSRGWWVSPCFCRPRVNSTVYNV